MSHPERFDPALPEHAPGTKVYNYVAWRHEKALPYVRDKTVLDIPCGVGWGTKMLMKTARMAFGVDRDGEAVCEAMRNFWDPNIIYLRGNMVKFPCPIGSPNDLGPPIFVDVVTCFEGYEHLDQEAQPCFLAEVKRVLKESGLLIMTVPVIKTNNPWHLHEPTKQELQDALSRDFDILEFENIEHHSVWVVAQLKRRQLPTSADPPPPQG